MNPRESITRQIHGRLEWEPRINLHCQPISISNARRRRHTRGRSRSAVINKLPVVS